MAKKSKREYAARLDIDYPGRLNRLTTFFRPILMIPIAIIVSLLSTGLWFATLLMMLMVGAPLAEKSSFRTPWLFVVGPL